MKTLKLLTSVLLALTILVSCGGGSDPVAPDKPIVPEKPQGPSISVPSGAEDYFSKGMTFDTNAGEKSFTFQTDADWTISVASTRNGANWCSVSPTSGQAGKHTVIVKTEANTSYDNRKVSLTLAAGSTKKTIVITQKQQDALTLTQDKFEVDAKGGTIEVEVKANISYDVIIPETSKGWICRASRSRGLSASKLVFNIAESEELEKREGEILIKSGDISETIYVYQSGQKVLLLSQNEFNIAAEGETIKVELRSNVDFGVKMPQVDWISEMKGSRAASSHTLYYVIKANETYDERSAEIVFADKDSSIADTLKIVQSHKDALIIGQKEFTVKAKGGNIQVELMRNVEYETKINCDWITKVDSRGLSKEYLTFSIKPNEMSTIRKGIITIISKDRNLRGEILVTQTPMGMKAKLMSGRFLYEKMPKNVTKVIFKTNTKATDLSNRVSLFESAIPAYLEAKDTIVIICTEADEFVFNSSCEFMFMNMKNLSDIQFENCNTSEVNRTADMFNGCESLKKLDLSFFDTRSVSDISGMFGNCSNLTSLNLTSFDTSNVYDMSYVFRGCEKLKNLDLTNFNTDNVRDMRYMFENCSSLDALDISHFNTSNVRDMQYMFNGCSGLVALDVSHFNTSNVNDMQHMFSRCSSLVALDVTHFNTSNVNNMRAMFRSCSNLLNLDLSRFITDNVTDMGGMFDNCSNLINLDLSKFNTNKVTNMGGMFNGCSSLSHLDLSKFNTSKVVGMNSMFSGCTSLTHLDLSKFNTSKVVGMNSMFSECTSLTHLDLSSFDTRNVTNMEFMFENCSNLDRLDLGTAFKITGDVALLCMCKNMICKTLKCIQSTKDVLQSYKTCLAQDAVTNWVILEEPSSSTNTEKMDEDENNWN